MNDWRENLRKILDGERWSWNRLAKEIGVPQTTVSNWMRDEPRGAPQIHHCIKIAEVTGRSLDELFRGLDPDRPAGNLVIPREVLPDLIGQGAAMMMRESMRVAAATIDVALDQVSSGSPATRDPEALRRLVLDRLQGTPPAPRSKRPARRRSAPKSGR